MTGLYPVDARVGPEMAPRPDTFYAVSKIAGEAVGRLYAEKFGLAVACLRIGTFAERPTARRHLSTWASHADTVRAFGAAMSAPGLDFAIFYVASGESATSIGTWTPGRPSRLSSAGPCGALGRPLRRVENPELQGGEYASPEYTLSRQRRHGPVLSRLRIVGVSSRLVPLDSEKCHRSGESFRIKQAIVVNAGPVEAGGHRICVVAKKVLVFIIERGRDDGHSGDYRRVEHHFGHDAGRVASQRVEERLLIRKCSCTEEPGCRQRRRPGDIETSTPPANIGSWCRDDHAGSRLIRAEFLVHPSDYGLRAD